MKRWLVRIMIVVALGFSLASASILVNRSYAFEPCSGQLQQVRKGFPLPYLWLKPSESLCQSVVSPAVLLRGNAFHEEYPWSFVVDCLVWGGAVAVVMVVRQRCHRTRS